MKTLIRSIRTDNCIECSWYDKNGRRYRHIVDTTKCGYPTVADKDNQHGFRQYAEMNGFQVIDQWTGNHPKRLNKNMKDGEN